MCGWESFRGATTEPQTYMCAAWNCARGIEDKNKAKAKEFEVSKSSAAVVKPPHPWWEDKSKTEPRSRSVSPSPASIPSRQPRQEDGTSPGIQEIEPKEEGTLDTQIEQCRHYIKTNRSPQGPLAEKWLSEAKNQLNTLLELHARSQPQDKQLEQLRKEIKEVNEKIATHTRIVEEHQALLSKHKGEREAMQSREGELMCTV